MTLNQSNEFSPRTLSPVDVMLEAVWRVWHLRSRMVPAIGLPVLCVSAISIVGWQLGYESNSIESWIFLAIYSVSMAFAAVGCHRIILIGKQAVPKYGVNGLSAREWHFVGYSALLVVIMLLAFPLLGAIVYLPIGLVSEPDKVFDSALGQGAFYILWILVAYFVARLSLVLPACAVDKPLSVPNSWTLTRKNGWRLTLIVAIIPKLSEWPQEWIAALLPGWWGTTVSYLLFALFIPIEVAFLSVSYEKLVPPAPSTNKMIDDAADRQSPDTE